MKDDNGHTLVVMGRGDVFVGSAQLPSEIIPTEMLLIDSQGQQHQIGNFTKAYDQCSTAALKAVVRIRFENPESIDVLVHRLVILKAAMVWPEEQK